MILIRLTLIMLIAVVVVVVVVHKVFAKYGEK